MRACVLMTINCSTNNWNGLFKKKKAIPRMSFSKNIGVKGILLNMEQLF